MDAHQDWGKVLNGHPIFSKDTLELDDHDKSLELSINSLPRFTKVDPVHDEQAPSGRRQVMLIKDVDLIVAVGRTIRMTSLTECGLNDQAKKSYKTLNTPNVQFEIHQLALNPNSKLLAVAGAFQVAVVVLPRAGFTRLVPSTVDCKSLQVGQFYHAFTSSAPVAKIEWHPWGEGGSTLMVMTIDGKLREYDISVDTEEPQQVVSFAPPRKTSKSFIAQDVSEREVTSFTLGRGRADWGPLTIYAVMKSGDIYSVCPYMPKNASIPSSYIHALQCFVDAKRELSTQDVSSPSQDFSLLYEYQHKYVGALAKQLPPGTVFPAESRCVSIHPPTTVKYAPVRQGPFLLQPSPLTVEGSDAGDATDIFYLAFGNDDAEDSEGETERLGVVMIAYQDGKMDVCLDVDKVEARWDNGQHSREDLPMLAVYETVDLGLVSMLSKVDPSLLELLHGNHPMFLKDPIHDDTLYLYHAFGVHALNLSALLHSLAVALRAENDNREGVLITELQKSQGISVQPILSTFSVERRCSNPVVAVAVPNDVYLTYSIFMLTSVMRITSLPLTLRSGSPYSPKTGLPPGTEEPPLPELIPTGDGPRAYVSLLEFEPYVIPPIFSRPLGLPNTPRLALPPSERGSEFTLTPDTLRFMGQMVEHIRTQINEVQLAHKTADSRLIVQAQEFQRQVQKCRQILGFVEETKSLRREQTSARLKKIQANQAALLARLDRTLQSLMRRASPELSENETKWFDELKRMEDEVVGAGKYDEGSLRSRAKLLQREYDRLLPTLQELHKKEIERKQKLGETNQGIGVSQAFELGQRSNAERVRIEHLEDEIMKLAGKLNVEIGKPPQRIVSS